VEVATRLSNPLLLHLRTVLGDEHDLTVTHSWSELVDVVHQRPVDAIVVDPRIDGGMDLEPLEALLGRFPALPVVLYTALSPDSVKAMVELAKHGVRHVVLRGFDDNPRRFRELLLELPARQVSDMVWAKVAPCLAGSPPLLERALWRLFDAPHRFEDVEAVAQAEGMTRRSFDRWLDRAGLASARKIVLGARLARAFYFLRDPAYQLSDVTRKVGLPSPRLLARQIRAATGLTPTALRESILPEEFTERLAAMLCRRGGESHGTVR